MSDTLLDSLVVIIVITLVSGIAWVLRLRCFITVQRLENTIPGSKLCGMSPPEDT